MNFLVQIALMVISSIIQMALTPKPKPPPPATLSDVDAPTAEEGRPIPVVFGTVWLRAPNVLWYGDLQNSPIRRSSGKKG